jgi:hypothetical protein
MLPLVGHDPRRMRSDRVVQVVAADGAIEVGGGLGVK